MRSSLLALLGVCLFVVCSVPAQEKAPADKRLKLLFLGDRGPHAPADRFRQLAPVMKKRGIDLTYTEALGDLDSKKLAGYDGLVVYANQTKITADQEKALLDYVASGKGFIPLHCASYCFLNSPRYIDLVGAQFRSHGTGVFRTTAAEVDHPILKGYTPFSSWDETYLHHKHNEKDRVVLEYRVEGKVKEPWTWVRTHGKGRVFYTAWGHDQRTWGHAGFENLVERGIRWACGDDPAKAGTVFVPNDAPKMTKLAKGLPAFEYAEAKIPFYPANARWGTLGKPLTKMQKPVSPEESMKHMVTPEGFEVKLFASEKLLGGKPLCMNWDERGRLWVAITMDYPNELRPAGKGRDRIVILEDTDHDGVADKVTTFAEKLSIPTSIAFANGGVIVHQAPHTLFLTEKDGKEASRKVLFTGWSTGDTHAGPSNLWYGLDNWMHGIVGYAGYRGRVGDERHAFGQGFYRFRPDGTKLEFLRSTNNNSWGVGFSEEGLHFGSTANGNPSVYLPIPNRYYEKVNGWSSSALGGIAGNDRMYPITERVRQVDFHGHFTAAAGHSLYTARTYPRDYWNRTAFVAEPTGHLLATFTLTRDGADFTSRNSWNLLASDDEWCAPIMAEVGPDGHVWVLDWYNFIVQHNPTPAGYTMGKGKAYETDLRDKKHGRIYRVVYKKAPKYKPLDLSKADAKTLVATLKHDNMRWRLHAQRLLVERGKHDVVPDLLKLIEDKKVDEIGLNVGAIHALWTLHGLKALKDQTLYSAAGGLIHPSAGVRRNAALVLPTAKGVADKSVDLIVINRLPRDDDAQVRLAALLALADMPSSEQAGKALAAQAQKADLSDRWIADAFTSAAAAHDWPFLLAVSESKEALSADATRVLRVVAEHWARGKPTGRVIDFLRSLRIRRPDVAGTILFGLAQGWPAGTKPEGFDSREALPLLRRLDAPGRVSLLRLFGAMGATDLDKHIGVVVKPMLETVADDKAGEGERADAARQVVSLLPASDDAVKQLLEAVTFQTPPAVVDGILDAVAASTAKQAGPELIKKLSGWTPATKSKAIRVLLSRRTSTSVLLDAIDKGSVKLSDLALDHKQALAAHPDKEIAARAKKLLAKGGDLPNADREKVVKALLPLLKKKGDVAKGKVVYKNQCAKCHKHTGEGEDIGPDLTGMAVHPKEELLIHIMDPSRSVEGNFRIYTVTTTDGKVHTGMLANESRTTIELVDSEAKRTTIQKSKVELLSPSEKSLMPDGFEKQLKEPEIVDLLEFLTHKGKYLPLPLDKAATIVSTKGMFYDADSTVERLVFDDWKQKAVNDVPFVLVDPRGDRVNNVILLHSREGKFPPKMPKSASVPCNTSAKAVHILGGVGGWAHPYSKKGSVSMIVRLHYKDGKTEDHELMNGLHVFDYIRKTEDTTGSKVAFELRGRQQVRYLSVTPKRSETITKIEFVKGTDVTAPVVVAVTVEPR